MKRSFLGFTPVRISGKYDYDFVVPDFKPVEQILDVGADILPNTLNLASDPRSKVLYEKLNVEVSSSPSLIDISEVSDSELCQAVDKYFELQ